MKIALYAVAILVAIGGAYFSFDLSERLEGERKARMTAVDENRNVTASADAKEAELATERDTLKTAQEQQAQVEESITSLRSNQVTLKRELGELEGQLEEQQVAFGQAEKALAEVQKILEGLGPDVTIDNLGDTVTQIREDVKARRTKLEDLEKLVAAAEERLAANRAESARQTDRRVERAARISRNAMEAVITAVDQDWGFVVIGAGSNSGFTPQTSLLVRRGNRYIGRVRPSAIEPSQTIADIEADTLAPGVRLQPGDRVILAKPQN